MRIFWQLDTYLTFSCSGGFRWKFLLWIVTPQFNQLFLQGLILIFYSIICASSRHTTVPGALSIDFLYSSTNASSNVHFSLLLCGSSQFPSLLQYQKYAYHSWICCNRLIFGLYFCILLYLGVVFRTPTMHRQYCTQKSQWPTFVIICWTLIELYYIIFFLFNLIFSSGIRIILYFLSFKFL